MLKIEYSAARFENSSFMLMIPRTSPVTQVNLKKKYIFKTVFYNKIEAKIKYIGNTINILCRKRD